MGGSEALAETFFGIMKHQYKDNSSIETADMRTIVSYCFPDVSKCPNAIAAISKLYREGDLQNKVAPHRSPIIYDARCRTVGKYGASKAIDSSRRKDLVAVI